MKRVIGLIPAALMLSLSACHPQEASTPVDSNPEVVKDAENSVQAEAPAQEVKEVNMAAVDSTLGFYYKDRRNADLQAKYKQALKLIVDQMDMHGTMENTSRRFGDWYIIGIDDNIRENPETMPTDAPAADHVFTYVVDLNSQKVIAQNDFVALRPLFDALDLVHHQPSDSADDEQRFLGALAALVASVADKHWRFIEPMTGQHFPDGVGGPKLEVNEDTAVFTYFTSSSGMRISFTKNQLTISPKEIVFNSEIMPLQ